MEIFTEKLGDDFRKNCEMIDSLLRVDKSFDIIKREMKIAGANCVMYYIDGFVKAELMQKLMVYLISVKEIGDGGKDAAYTFAAKSVPTVEVDVTDSADNIILMVLSGCTAFLSEGFGPNAIIIDSRTYPARSTEEPEGDRVMRGSRDGFVETLIFNTAMLRRRIRDTSFTVEYLNIGKRSRTDIAICYMDGIADAEYVSKLRANLESIDADSIILGHQSIAESLIRTRWYNPFPKIRTTERPDAAAASVLEGSVIVICDNAPEVMILPTSIFDFLQETDDYYFPPFTGSYLRILRQFVFFAAMLITPLWYLLVSNPEILHGRWRFLIPADPGEVPLIVQLFLIEFTIDGLKLASLNTPSMLSNSFSVVGGLLLGDFAVKAGWLCPEVIVYMAFVSIANFAQPSYELGYAFKYMRMLLLFATWLFGVWGFFGGIVLGLILVASNKTINGERSYLYPLIPFNASALGRLFLRRLKPICTKESEK